ncbi:D-glycero-alpha-D-manno-heptose-1,7-bisphosphate 7-phosphatase [Kiloniella antarctica]|uniref:D,D-heptose 1,7-bisphosphate phosphatase n=1 Tax=Kiloniella antarctica TaxID=1550907 RepID=A0ABW5BNW9_9PROT
MTSIFLSTDYPYVSQTGVWEENRNQSSPFPSTPKGANKLPALFLDRDGVIVKEVNYLQNPKDVHLIQAAADIIAKANKKKVPVIMVTNQAGIAYGMFGWKEFDSVQRQLHDDLEKEGAHIDAVFACPFHQKGDTIWGDHPDHEARKPQPGMLFRATQMLDIDLERSWIVGDRASDIEAGLNAGLAGGLHVLTGHGNRSGEVSLAREHETEHYKVRTGSSIADSSELPIFFA